MSIAFVESGVNEMSDFFKDPDDFPFEEETRETPADETHQAVWDLQRIELFQNLPLDDLQLLASRLKSVSLKVQLLKL